MGMNWVPMSPVATPTKLLCKKERDFVVICGVKTRAKDAAVIKCTIPGRSSLVQSQSERHGTHDLLAPETTLALLKDKCPLDPGHESLSIETDRTYISHH